MRVFDLHKQADAVKYDPTGREYVPGQEYTDQGKARPGSWRYDIPRGHPNSPVVPRKQVWLTQMNGMPLILGDTYPVKEMLEQLGFRFYGQVYADGSQFGQPGKIFETGFLRQTPLTPQDVSVLQTNLGVDVSQQGVEIKKYPTPGAPYRRDTEVQQPQQESVPNPEHEGSLEQADPGFAERVRESIKNAKSYAASDDILMQKISELTTMMQNPQLKKEAEERVGELFGKSYGNLR